MGRIISAWALVCRFKYLVVVSIMVFVMGYLDENSYYERSLRWARIRQYKTEIADCKARYEYDAACLRDLESNPATVERLARERYYMSRPNEDIFVVRRQEPDTLSLRLIQH